jgi:hypothetical protein
MSLVGFSAPALAQAVDLAAPTPEGVALRIAADQNGAVFVTQTGDQIAVELMSNAGTGGAWVVSEQPAFMGEATQLTAPARALLGGRPLIGAPRWDVFVFAITGPGVGDLLFTKLGPVRSGDSTPAETFRVTITAQ